jgi:hypothetical protein
MAWNLSNDVEHEVQSLREMIQGGIEKLNEYIAYYEEIES